MDIEKLIGVTVDTVEGIEVGEIVGIEIYGTKIHLIMDGAYAYMDGGPDGDGGIPVEVPKKVESDGKPGSEPKIGDNVVDIRKRG